MGYIHTLIIILTFSMGINAQVFIDFEKLKQVGNKNHFMKIVLDSGFEFIGEDEYELSFAYGFNDIDSTAQVWAYYRPVLETFSFVIYDVDYYEYNNRASLYSILTEEIKKCNYVKPFIDGFGFEDNLTYLLYSCPTSKYKGKIGFCLKTEKGLKVGRIRTFDNGYIEFCEGTRENK